MDGSANTSIVAQSAAVVPGRDVEPGEFKVLIAGGGVGGLEAVLALRELAPPGLSVELLSPRHSHTLVPLSVLEPFRTERTPEIVLPEFCEEHDVTFIHDGLSEIWPGQQRVLTDGGTELYYDALLLSMGAQRRPLIEGAINFRGPVDADVIEGLTEAGSANGRIAFVIPPALDWTLPLYELALLLADRLGDSAPIEIATHERRPLEAFGPSASELVARLLADAGIALRTGVTDHPQTVGDIEADTVITLPRPFVPDIPGVPQLAGGFVPVDAQMGVAGPQRVWAVGDITWSPIKQGGLATQQADIAAAAIAATAGAPVDVPPYVPVLRAALMTAQGPYYLRSGSPDGDGELRAPLWWPPAKIAGRLLAPYLAQRVDFIDSDGELRDLAIDVRRHADHREAHQLTLHWAELDAEQGELRRALYWLEIAEGLELALPEEYQLKRAKWRDRLAGS